MRSEDSPRLMTLGSEAMMRLCEEAGEADRLCSQSAYWGQWATAGHLRPGDNLVMMAAEHAGSLQYKLGGTVTDP